MIQTIKTKYQKKRQKKHFHAHEIRNGWAGKWKWMGREDFIFQFTASSKMKAAQYLGDA